MNLNQFFMKFYSQLDYPTDYLGTSRSTIADYGCVVVSLANLVQKDPLEVNDILVAGGAFYNEAYIVFPTIGDIFGVEYQRTAEKPSQVCIAETHDTSTPQHFFLYNPETDEMIDPLDKNPEWRANTYNIVSYRVLDGLWENPEVEVQVDSQIVKLAEMIMNLAKKEEVSIDKEQKMRIWKKIRRKAELIQNKCTLKINS